MGGPPSPRTVEVGEIDTKAPFQSVKAALSLFGVPSSSPPSTKPVYTKKPKPQAQVSTSSDFGTILSTTIMMLID